MFARTQFTTGAGTSTDSSRLHYADAELALSVDVQESNIDAQQIDILGVSYVDVKGKFIGVNNNSALTFPIIQKLMYHDVISSGVYINKIKPLAARGLFNYTFTPSAYIHRKDGNKRTVVFKTRTYSEYLDSLQPVKKTRKARTIKAKSVKDTDNNLTPTIDTDESDT